MIIDTCEFPNLTSLHINKYLIKDYPLTKHKFLTHLTIVDSYIGNDMKQQN